MKKIKIKNINVKEKKAKCELCNKMTQIKKYEFEGSVGKWHKHWCKNCIKEWLTMNYSLVKPSKIEKIKSLINKILRAIKKG